MKIGIDIRALMDKQYSGVSEYTFNLVKALLKINADRKLGHQFKLFYNSFTDLESRMPKFDYPATEVIATKYPNKLFNYILTKLGNYPQIDKILDVDLFFMPHLNFAALSPSVKKAITIHDLSFLRYPEYFSWRKQIWHKSLCVPRILRGFDRITAVSEHTKKDVIELIKIPTDKVHVIKPGIDHGVFHKISDAALLDDIRCRYDLPDKFILFLSTFEPRKNIAAIIQAYEKFSQDHGPTFDLVLVGRDGWNSADILKAIAAYQGPGRIKRIDYIDNHERAPFYNLASVLIYPSLYEGFGLPILEAAACGTPVIAGANSSMPEVAAGASLLVDPFNAAEMTSALASILDNRELRQRMIDNGLAHARDYSWEQTASEYFKLIFN